MSITPLDARGPQFNAALTSVVLAVALATAHLGVGVWLLGAQAVLFAIGVAFGVQRTPAAYLFRRFVKPHLGPAARLEDPRPPRFAQGIGLAFAVLGVIGFVAGPTWLGYLATGFALAAALLNATIQVCLGCQIYGVCHLPQQQFNTPPTTNKKEALA